MLSYLGPYSRVHVSLVLVHNMQAMTHVIPTTVREILSDVINTLFFSKEPGFKGAGERSKKEGV